MVRSMLSLTTSFSFERKHMYSCTALALFLLIVHLAYIHYSHR
jgi:hypothetical protein